VNRLSWFTRYLHRAVNNKDTRLVPNTKQETTFSQTTNLRYVFPTHVLFFAHNQRLLIRIKCSKKESISTTKRKSIWCVTLNYFVNISAKRSSLIYFNQLRLALEFYYVNKSLILPTYHCVLVYTSYRKYKILGRNLIQYFKSLGVDHV